MPQGNVVTLHPAALNEMAEVLALVAAHLPDFAPQKDREVVEAVRSIIRHVTVLDREDGGVDCEITGDIAPLVATNLVGGGGSGGPLHASTPQLLPDLLIRVQAA